MSCTSLLKVKNRREMSENTWFKDIALSLASGLNTFKRTEDLTDITIKIESQTFKCHKVVLAAVSPYFKAMFLSDFKERNKTEIELKEIRPEAFEIILSLIYAEKGTLTEDNIDHVLSASTMLQIDCIIKRCEAFLIERLSIDNCIHIWKIGHLHSSNILENHAFQLILKSFLEISNQDSFLELKKEEVSKIISQNELNVLSEEQVCEVIMRWIRADYSARTEMLLDILKCIRFPIMSARSLKQVMKRHTFLKSDPGVTSILIDGLCLREIPECRLASSKQTSFHRSRMEFMDVFVAGQMSYSNGNCFLLFDFLTEKLHRSLTLGPINVCDVLCTCDNIYLLGYYGKQYAGLFIVDPTKKYNVKELEVTYESPFFAISKKAFMIPVDYGIYFANRKGGSGNFVMYASSSGFARLGTKIPQMENVNAAVIAQSIYLFCNLDTEINVILRCNPRHKIKKVGNLTHKAPFTKVMVEDDNIYVIFQDGNIWKLTENENGDFAQEYVLNVPDFSFSEFSSVIHLSKMYFFSPGKEVISVNLNSGKLTKFSGRLRGEFSCNFFNKVVVPRCFVGGKV